MNTLTRADRCRSDNPAASPAAAFAGKQRLFALQGLRACAAAMVVFVHALATYGTKVDTIADAEIFGGLGELGVKLFFCISGFIIFNASTDLAAGPASVLNFWRRRVIRVVPIYWLATSVYAAKLALQGLAPSPAELGMSLFFVPYSNEYALMRPVLGVGWSLNYEMLFYALVGVSLLLGKCLRTAFVVFALALLVGLRMSGGLLAGDGTGLGRLFLLSDYYLFYFLAGLLVGVLREKFAKRRPALSLNFTAALLTCSGLLAGYLVLHTTGAISKAFMETGMGIVCVLCVGVSVMEFKAVDHATDGRAKRGIGLAGDASYSTYLTHGFVMGPVARLVSYADFNITALAFSLLMVPMCTGVGILVYRWVERPLIRRVNARFPYFPQSGRAAKTGTHHDHDKL